MFERRSRSVKGCPGRGGRGTEQTVCVAREELNCQLIFRFLACSDTFLLEQNFAQTSFASLTSFSTSALKVLTSAHFLSFSFSIFLLFSVHLHPNRFSHLDFRGCCCRNNHNMSTNTSSNVNVVAVAIAVVVVVVVVASQPPSKLVVKRE